MQVADDERGYLFTYPALYKWLFGGGALFLLAMTVLALLYGGRGRDAWVAVLFLAFGCVCGYCWLFMQGHVLLGERAITLTRFGRSTRIEYAQITRLEHRPADAIVIDGEGRSIRIERQLHGYPVFYETLMSLIPHSPTLPASFPLRVTTQRWVHVLNMGFILGGMLFVGLALSCFLRGDMEGVEAAGLMGALALGIGVYSSLKLPREYIFDSGMVECFTLLGHQTFRVMDLKDIRLEHETHAGQTLLLLRLIFEGGEIQVREAQVAYPLLDLAKLLTDCYLAPWDPQAGRETSYVPAEQLEFRADPHHRGRIRVGFSRRGQVALAITTLVCLALPEALRACAQAMR